MNYEWIKSRKKILVLLFAATLILFLLQGMNAFRQSKIYEKKDGCVLAVKRNSMETEAVIPLIVEFEEDGRRKSFQINLSFHQEGDSEKNTDSDAVNGEEQVKRAVQEMVKQLEAQDSLLIRLPKQLEEGTKLTWKTPSFAKNFLLILLFPLGCFYLYRNDVEKEKQRKKRKCEEIKKALPAFNDQLLLLMNSGLIFHDAFACISRNYQKRTCGNCFFTLITDIWYQAEITGRSLISVMKETAKDVSVGEYSRMVSILMDNQVKGVDLREKLESESIMLWEMRKAISLQKGKELETKLSFPLALLLVVLMIIAGAPAVITM